MILAQFPYQNWNIGIQVVIYKLIEIKIVS